MKKIHVVGFIIGLCVILFAGVVYPQLAAMMQYGKAVETGDAKLLKGDMVGGLGDMQHAVNLIKTRKALPENLSRGLKMQLLAVAVRNPLESHKILEFLVTNGMAPDCNERMSLYHAMLQGARNFAGNADLEKIRECLYLAAYWGGSCEVNEKNLKDFRLIFKVYKKERDDLFQQESWMEPAYRGAPVVASEQAPVTSAQAADAVAGGVLLRKLTGGVDRIKSTVGIAGGGGEPAAPVAGQTPPAPASPVPAEPVPQPAAAQQEKKSDVPRADTIHLSEKLLEKEDDTQKKEHEKEQTQEPAAAREVGFVDKVKMVPGMVVNRVTGLFGRDGKESGVAEKKKSAVSQEVLNKEIETAVADIRSIMTIHEIKVETLHFSGDGDVIYVAFISGNIGDKKLAEELKAVFSSIHERIGQMNAGILPLRTMSVQLKDTNGNPRAHWNIEYSDYIQYREEKIDGAEFRKRWKERIL